MTKLRKDLGLDSTWGYRACSKQCRQDTATWMELGCLDPGQGLAQNRVKKQMKSEAHIPSLAAGRCTCQGGAALAGEGGLLRFFPSSWKPEEGSSV